MIIFSEEDLARICREAAESPRDFCSNKGRIINREASLPHADRCQGTTMEKRTSLEEKQFHLGTG